MSTILWITYVYALNLFQTAGEPIMTQYSRCPARIFMSWNSYVRYSNRNLIFDFPVSRTYFSGGLNKVKMFKAVESKIYLLLILFCFITGCGGDYAGKADSGTDIDSMTIVLTGQRDRSVLEITMENHDVGYIESSTGAFVRRIDSVENKGRYGWVYSVNDTPGQTAADKYMTSDSDIIKWHFRKF